MTSEHSRFAVGITNCRSATSVIDGVREAESLGAEIAFVAEDVNCRDSFELLAASALQTESIRLATGVVNPYTRNPTSLAMAIATLDELSHGRAVLGLGTSTPSLIQGQMGIPIGKSLETMREATEVVQALLTGMPISYPGKRFVYFEASLEAKPVQEHIPIFFAAMGPQMLRLVGSHADGVLLNVGASTDYVRWAVEQVHKGAETAGRDPAEITIAAWLTVYLSDDYEDGLQRAREWLVTMLSVPRQGELLLEHAGYDLGLLDHIRAHYGHYPPRGERAEAAKHVPPEAAEKMTIIGPQERVRERLAEYRAAGVQLPVMSSKVLRSIYA